MNSLAPWLVFFSLVVAAPRMAYFFIAMDGRGVEGAAFVVVVVVALATSVALTGGQFWLAWRITRYKGHRIKLWCAWVSILIGATVIGAVACLLLILDKGGVETVTDPKWLAAHIPAAILALVVAGLPEIMAAAISVGHGDGVVVDEVVERQDAQLIAQGLKLMEAEATVRHKTEELQVMRKRAEVAEEALVKPATFGAPVKAENPASPNGNRRRSRKKIAGMKLLQEGIEPSEVARRVKVHRSTVLRWAKELGP